jgi:LuxR family transcriptional regulator, maltose regulon positive regulatory protein
MHEEAGSKRLLHDQPPVGKEARTLDPLLSTKLHPPQARPKLVARSRLIESIAREPGRRLTLISAPAGFGKTTLLGKWWLSRTGGESPAAWISLDGSDNDLARFLSYLVAALRRTA